ncbi:MAG: hypothetical protein AAF388_28565, partial [Bacteroidota bacterium]
SSTGSPTILPKEVIRATTAEKELQITNLENLHATHQEAAPAALKKLQETALQNGNMFEALMEAGKVCTLGQITHALFSVGGQYRRSM